MMWPFKKRKHDEKPRPPSAYFYSIYRERRVADDDFTNPASLLSPLNPLSPLSPISVWHDTSSPSCEPSSSAYSGSDSSSYSSSSDSGSSSGGGCD